MRPDQHATIFTNAHELPVTTFPTIVNYLSFRNNREECPKHAEYVTVLAERYYEYRVDAQTLSHARDFGLCIAVCAW